MYSIISASIVAKNISPIPWLGFGVVVVHSYGSSSMDDIPSIAMVVPPSSISVPFDISLSSVS